MGSPGVAVWRPPSLPEIIRTRNRFYTVGLPYADLRISQNFLSGSPKCLIAKHIGLWPAPLCGKTPQHSEGAPIGAGCPLSRGQICSLRQGCANLRRLSPINVPTGNIYRASIPKFRNEGSSSERGFCWPPAWSASSPAFRRPLRIGIAGEFHPRLFERQEVTRSGLAKKHPGNQLTFLRCCVWQDRLPNQRE